MPRLALISQVAAFVREILYTPPYKFATQEFTPIPGITVLDPFKLNYIIGGDDVVKMDLTCCPSRCQIGTYDT